MDKQIKKAFDDIHASDEIKNKTYQAIIHKKRAFNIKPVLVMACLLCLMITGGYVYSKPVYAISVDGEKSVELAINCFDKVIQVTGYDENGQMQEDKSLMHLNYQKALETLFSNDEDDSLTVTILGEDSNQSLLKNVQSCIPEGVHVHCDEDHYALVDEAHHQGMSYGKYKACMTLLELDPNTTLEEISTWSTKEIYTRINELSNNHNQRGHHGKHHLE